AGASRCLTCAIRHWRWCCCSRHLNSSTKGSLCFASSVEQWRRRLIHSACFRVLLLILS
ncbi:unnamed protein product, partial [Amoebophrya sp. A25]